MAADILIAVMSGLVLRPSCLFEGLLHLAELLRPERKVAVVIGLQLLVLFLQQFVVFLELGKFSLNCRLNVFDL